MRAQALAWVGLGALYYVFDAGRQPEPDLGVLLWRSLAWALSGAGLTSLWLWALRRIRIGERGVWLQLLVSLAGAVVGGFLWLTLFHQLDGWLSIEGGWVPMLARERAEIVAEWMDYALVLLVWHGGLLAHLQRRRASSAREQALRLAAVATEMRLQVLEAQLRPHFLFNTINAAMALIPDEPARAERVLQQLAALLRGALMRRNANVTVQDEMDLVRAYLDIEQVRYEEQLDVDIVIEPQAAGATMPSGLLLLLVDNAIKHGMRQSDSLRVEVSARRQDEQQIVLSVYNSGRLDQQQRHPQSLGIGLANVRERLAARFGPSAGFELVEDEGVWARVWFPYEGAS